VPIKTVFRLKYRDQAFLLIPWRCHRILLLKNPRKALNKYKSNPGVLTRGYLPGYIVKNGFWQHFMPVYLKSGGRIISKANSVIYS
jgi:hypothetical protein